MKKKLKIFELMDIPLEGLKKIIYLDNKSVLDGILSIYGDYTVGKTVLSLQIALNTILSGKKVIYIYSKPIFPHKIFKNLSLALNSKALSIQHKNLTLIKLNSFQQLYELVTSLEFVILDEINKKLPLTKLIIIDSITELYRLVLNPRKKEINFKQNFQLNYILGNLSYLNRNYKIEIVLINEISTKLINGEYVLVQSGGKVMDYWVKYSLEIRGTSVLNEREIILTKHPHSETKLILYKLKDVGFIEKE